MKIFITGGTGFIGKHLTRKLKEERHSLLLLSQQPLEEVDFIEGDLLSIDKWKDKVYKFKPDACVHLAWEGLPDYNASMNRKNPNYGLDLFTFLADIGCKTILSTGSAWEYRGRHQESLVEGTIIKKPGDTFCAAKWAINLWGTAIVEEKNESIIRAEDKLRFIWARILFIYGPGQRETSLIPYLINSWKAGKIPEIKNPFAKNDFIYIDDVVDAIIMLLEKAKKSGEYDLGSGRLTSNQEIINMVAGKLKVSWENKEEGKSGEVNCSFSPTADVSRIKKEIGWEPKVSIDEGIKKMVAYYWPK